MAHADLKLDLRNPRSPGEAFEDEAEALRYLVGFADVAELVGSIRAEGWLDYEPLIVDEKTLEVYEGNRRLAALRLLTDPKTRADVDNYELPTVPSPKEPPEKIFVKMVANRDEARAFIGFKHINGPHKWDALAKAKFAADWLDAPGAELASVARALGDAHSTVRRLVNGWRILLQAKAEGFDERPEATGKTKFPFSHLYTAVARPNVREYLGLQLDDDLLPKHPVGSDFLPNLRQFMQWLFGQGSKPAVIRSQNPDLNRLVDVMGNERALAMLTSTSSLSQAYELVEDKSERFREALLGTSAGIDDCMRLVRNYAGGQEDLHTANQLVRSTRLLRDTMQKIADGDGTSDGDL